MRHLLFVLALVPLLALGQGTSPLNDTGQTKCYNGTTLVDCDASNTGDAATYPRQDGRFGRDAQAAAGKLTKTGGGAAGFDFTPLDASGNAITLTGTPPVPSSTPTCVKDNVTGLIWEVKTDDAGLRDKDWKYKWSTLTGGTSCGSTLTPCSSDKYVTAVNAATLCGASDWRLPTRRELLSIVHHGIKNPAIDGEYFPNTTNYHYWSSDLYQQTPTNTFSVYFGDGSSNLMPHNSSNHCVRLVRGGQ